MSVYFIDGPPASGKTTLIKGIKDYIEKANIQNAAVVDEDFMFIDSLHMLDTAEYSTDWVNEHIQAVLSLLKRGTEIIFVDSSPLIARAYHPDMDESFIQDSIDRLSGYNVKFWFIDITWQETWWRIQSRLQFVPQDEVIARVKLGETNYEYMEKRYASTQKNRGQYDKILHKYYLLSLAKSLL